MANYRSLAGGFYSSTPEDKASGPVSIRMNNPGAINGAAWIRAWPGYVGEIETTPGNKSTIFETPEQGAAVWYELMRRYRLHGVKTVEGIITRYGGQQNYTRYVTFVATRTGLAPDTEIALAGDDTTLLMFAKAMFAYEAGRDTPLSDGQILYGFNLARKVDVPPVETPAPAPEPAPAPPATPKVRGLLEIVLDFLRSLFRSRERARARVPSPLPQQYPPRWLIEAHKDIGFRERGVNLGIEQFIEEGHTGHPGDPWCAIFVCAKLEECGIRSTRSPMARSFERSQHFVQLPGPALGAVATFWRGSPSSGSGHVNFYAGTDEHGRHIGIGGNQSDRVSAAIMDMRRHTGWWWPASEAIPLTGAVRVHFADVAGGGSET